MDNIQFQRSAIDASGAFTSAWEQVKSNYGTYLGVSLLTILMLTCLSCLGFFLLGPLMGGVFYVAMRGHSGQPVAFGMMFEGFKKFLPLMVVGLVQSIPAIILNVVVLGVQFGQVALIFNDPEAMRQVQRTGQLPGSDGTTMLILAAYAIFFVSAIVVWFLTFYAIPLVMDRDLGAIEALTTSAKAAFSNMGGMLTVMFFAWLVGMIGMLILCIGLYFISLPVIFVASAIVYRQVFPRQDRGDQFFAPPPPGTYGFGNPGY